MLHEGILERAVKPPATPEIKKVHLVKVSLSYKQTRTAYPLASQQSEPQLRRTNWVQ